MKCINKIAHILVIVGSLNWGLVGLFRYDLVERIFGNMTTASRLIYLLVGISALVILFTHKTKKGKCKNCTCSNKCCS